MPRKSPLSAWLPLAVAIVSVTATLIVWHALRNQERFQVERVVRLATHSIEADMVADMNIRIRDLADLGRLWSISEKPHKDEFDMRATLFLSHTPGCVAVGWVDPSLSPEWNVPVDGDIYILQLISSMDDHMRKTLASLSQTREPLVAKTVEFEPDQKIVPVWLPVFSGKEFRGFIVGIFRVQPLLDDITSDHADLGYEVVVSEGSESIFILSNAIPENQWAQEAKIPLPGNEWRLRIWPGPKALPETLPLSRVVLLGGLIMCIQLTLTVYLALRERNSALHVDAVNRELTEENSERRRAEESLHVLSGRLLTLQDEERRRIARDLHESTAQVLYGLIIKLRLLSQTVGSEMPQAQGAIHESIELADQCERDLRTMSYLLHPPSLDDLGLAPALRSLAAGFSERSEIEVSLDLPDDLGRLPRDVETALFRIVQESLGNVHRHSGSKTVHIAMSRTTTGEIALEITDEGVGFRPEILNTTVGLGVGIAGMRERVRQLGGRLEIRSSKHGTEVQAFLPSNLEETSNGLKTQPTEISSVSLHATRNYGT